MEILNCNGKHHHPGWSDTGVWSWLGPMVSWVLAVQMDSLECECVYGALRVVLGSVCSLDVSPPLFALVFVNCSTLTQCQWRCSPEWWCIISCKALWNLLGCSQNKTVEIEMNRASRVDHCLFSTGLPPYSSCPLAVTIPVGCLVIQFNQFELSKL